MDEPAGNDLFTGLNHKFNPILGGMDASAPGPSYHSVPLQGGSQHTGGFAAPN